ncbi:MAG: MtrB/PioB family outer membrane beta-barrel protein [Nitrospirae bacterium]|nr:MtrB/PioB family outer membrane beta-barrel protein [Nitrospirota bacterium]MBF0591381.1 MtrB/PioB family outer membrane beta-barrel protein [Nitrospirota bacterium]
MKLTVKLSMQTKLIIVAMILTLIPFSVGFAYDLKTETDPSILPDEIIGDRDTDSVLKLPAKLEGEIILSGKMVGMNGNKTKFNEYNDVETGLFGLIRLKYDDDTYYVKLKALDMGYDDQNYKAEGGIYGQVKYYLEYNEIPHSYSLGDKTIYSGSGSGNLVLVPNYKNGVAAWNSIDYAIKRQQENGGIRLDMLKPFYVEFNGQREDRTGTRPLSATNSNGSSGPISEFAQPINYITNTYKGELGYLTKEVFASAYLQYSDFDNANHNMNFQSIYAGSSTIPNRVGLTDTMTLPPDNQSYKYGFKGFVALPLQSKFNVNLSGSETTSGAALPLSSLIGTSTTLTKPTYTYSDGATNWHGKVDNQNYNFVLTSNPLPFLNANLYYKYYASQNKSDELDVTSKTGETNTATPISYHKNNFGAELGFKLPSDFHLTTGYDYVTLSRTVNLYQPEGMPYIIPKTTDNIYKVALRWTGLDFLTPKIGYERMNRDGVNDLSLLNAVTTVINATRLAPYKDQYDIGSQNRDKFKVGVDIFPAQDFNLGLGYNYVRSSYPDTEVGLRNQKRDQVMVDAGYAFGEVAKLNVYGEYENIRTYQLQRNFNTATAADPNSPTQNATNYNWDLTLTDRSYNYGAGLDIYVIPRKVTIRLQYDYVDSNGNGDFTILNQAALTALGKPTTAVPAQDNSNIDIGSLDDYKQHSLMGKVIWNVSKAFAVVTGYAYQQYKYNDAAYNNYPTTYVIPDSSGNVNYISGAYANPSYNASLVFLTLAYKF